ncbi:G-protein-signaling modulator 1-like [Xyrauchen texanus]|uniref:G-protein-signaling modulator 1-like n=1 Tax=Xyrauchen texanus TaxID=154827 RepID=UPI002242325F|nr:G-protein-signaling modulator 1-like [Xyrauchen texanus]XP_052002565.1 G-protein-signaling modulator 1-like [Xyrauchen texanus]
MESSVEATMESTEVTAETSADTQLEPLLIFEEGDEPSDMINSTERGSTVLRVRQGEANRKDETGNITEAAEGSQQDENNVHAGKSESGALEEVVNEEGNVNVEHQQEEKLEDHEGCVNMMKTDGRLSDGTKGVAEKMPKEEIQEPVEKMTDASTQDKPNAQVKLRPKDRLSPDDAKQMVHRLSADSPDALCELLYMLQEGRRLNDQRCSFRLEGRRRCYSEPSTPRHSQKVVFSSMTSLQKEEFFDYLAISQSRRLDDQRAELQNIPPAPPPPQPKSKQRKSSCKVTEVTPTVPTPTPKEDLYNMIVISQAQGRLEEQRSAAPGPMDDEDFFSLLLKVQGGRMDEQRTELKPDSL